MRWELTILGVRGSMSVCTEDTARYGGNTTCCVLRRGEDTLLLDAGTGLCRMQPDKRMHLLLSHSHMDHLLGIPVFSGFYDPEGEITVSGPDWEGRSIREQVDCFLRPPLWPVTAEVFRAKTEFRGISPERPLQLGGFTVQAMPVCHPGATYAYRISAGGRSLVFATDAELDAEDEAFLRFARDCDLLLIDGQYTREELPKKRGWGHSAMEDSALLGKLCGAGSTVLIHHAPERKDAELDALLPGIQAINPRACFGRELDRYILE